MRTGGQRVWAIVALVAVVLTLGVVSWLAGRGSGSAPTASPQATPVRIGHFPHCPASGIELTGAVNECTVVDPSFVPYPCDLHGTTLEDSIQLRGERHNFFLIIDFDATYASSRRTYALVPWPGSYFNTGDYITKVELRELVTVGYWHSISGTVTLSSSSFKSGSIDAALASLEGSSRTDALHVSGSWNCG